MLTSNRKLRSLPSPLRCISQVELAVLCQSVAEVRTNILIQFPNLGLLAGVRHIFLDQLQALCMSLMLNSAHVWMWEDILIWNIYAGLGCELCDATLFQIQV